MNSPKLSASTLLLSLFSSIASAAPTITSIGIINQDPSISSKAEAINADGTVVVGTNLITAGVNYAIPWSVTGGLQNLSCGANSGLYAVSSNGNSADADFNKDGNIDFFDYLDFVDFYSGGC